MRNMFVVLFGILFLVSLPTGCEDPGTGDDDDIYGDDDIADDDDNDTGGDDDMLTVVASITGGADNPVGKIFVDDIDTGVFTPGTVIGLENGTHDLRVELDGYCHADVEVDVDASSTNAANVDLNVNLTGTWHREEAGDNIEVTMDDCTMAYFDPVAFEVDGHVIDYTNEWGHKVTGTASYDQVAITVCNDGDCVEYTYTRVN